MLNVIYLLEPRDILVCKLSHSPQWMRIDYLGSYFVSTATITFLTATWALTHSACTYTCMYMCCWHVHNEWNGIKLCTLHMHFHTLAHVHTHTYIHTYTYAHVHTYIHTHTCTHTCTLFQVSTLVTLQLLSQLNSRDSLDSAKYKVHILKFWCLLY